jgi:hypothetical protein
MTAIKVKRTIIRRTHVQPSKTRQTFHQLERSYLAVERTMEFAIEALLFGIIVAISAWPVFAAADALHEFLQQTPG